MATTAAPTGDLTARSSTNTARSSTNIHRTARLITKSRQALKTTEFWAMAGLIVAILTSVISAAVITGQDQFIARQAWLYVWILGVGYLLSRGFAKSGSRKPYTDDSGARGDAGARDRAMFRRR